MARQLKTEYGLMYQSTMEKGTKKNNKYKPMIHLQLVQNKYVWTQPIYI